MKRLAVLITTFLASTAGYSAPVGNTSMPQLIQKGFFIPCDSWIGLRVGYEGDFVSDGRMKQIHEGHGRVDTYKQWTNSGTLTFNVLDRMDFYGVFGASKTEADWRFENSLEETVTRIKVETNESFLWAIGGRAILYEWGPTSLGLGGRYSSCHYAPNEFTSNGSSQPTEGSQLNWEEWQMNGDISYRIDLFTPYMGIKYLSAKTNLNNFSAPISQNSSRENSFESRVPVGFYLGCALSTGKYFMLNLEARLIDEEAVSVFGEFRF